MMTQDEIKQLFINTGAIMDGHFLLTSGLHSPLYVEKFQVLQYPQHTETLCKELAARFVEQKVEVVVGPITGGILLAHEVGKALGTRALFTERENGQMALRRGFQIQPGERVLVVEDIVTTGGSIQEVIDVVRALGGEVVGVGMLVNRSSGKAQFDVPAVALLELEVQTYQPEQCPLCQASVPMTKRGSRNLAAKI